MSDYLEAVADRLERAADRMFNAGLVDEERSYRDAAAQIRGGLSLEETRAIEQLMLTGQMPRLSNRLTALAAQGEYDSSGSDSSPTSTTDQPGGVDDGTAGGTPDQPGGADNVTAGGTPDQPGGSDGPPVPGEAPAPPPQDPVVIGNVPGAGPVLSSSAPTGSADQSGPSQGGWLTAPQPGDNYTGAPATGGPLTSYVGNDVNWYSGQPETGNANSWMGGPAADALLGVASNSSYASTGNTMNGPIPDMGPTAAPTPIPTPTGPTDDWIPSSQLEGRAVCRQRHH